MLRSKSIEQLIGLKSVLRTWPFDVDDWNEACRQVDSLRRLNADLSKTTGGNPVQDVFLSLIKHSPKIRDDIAATDPDLLPLAALMESVLEREEFKKVKRVVNGDLVLAAFAARAFSETFLSRLDEKTKQAMKNAVKKAWALTYAKRDLEILEYAGADKTKRQKAAARVEAMRKAANSAVQELKKALQDGNNFDLAVAAGSQEAVEKVDPISRIAASFSLAAGGDPQRIDHGVTEHVVRLLNHNRSFIKIAQMIGRLRSVINGLEGTVRKGNVELTGYHRGYLSDRTSPSEMAMAFANPVLQVSFVTRAVEGQLVNRQFLRKKAGRGGIIVVRDESSSMRGDPHTLSVAVEWALIETCRKEGRRFISIPFSGPGQRRVWEMPKKYEPYSLYLHLIQFYDGGTEPYQAVKIAVEEAAKDKDNGADILVITDGMFDSPPPRYVDWVLDEKKKKGFRVFVVTLGDKVPKERLPIRDVVDYVFDNVEDAIRSVVL